MTHSNWVSPTLAKSGVGTRRSWKRLGARLRKTLNVKRMVIGQATMKEAIKIGHQARPTIREIDLRISRETKGGMTIDAD